MIGLLGMPATAGRAFATPKLPRGAFLRQPAHSVRDLNRELHRDPLVCARYARTFHLDSASLYAGFRKLRLIRLPHDGIFQVHYVHPGEEIGYRVRRVRRGTPVYALPDGTPVLVEICGNPLRPYLTSSILMQSQSLLVPKPALSETIPDLEEDEAAPPRAAADTRAPGDLRRAAPPLALASPRTPAAPGGSGPTTPENRLSPSLPMAAFSAVPFLSSLPISLPALPGLLGISRAGTHRPKSDFIPSPDAAPPRVLPVPKTPPLSDDQATHQIGDWTKQPGVDLPPGPLDTNASSPGRPPETDTEHDHLNSQTPGDLPSPSAHVIPEPGVVTLSLALASWLYARFPSARRKRDQR